VAGLATTFGSGAMTNSINDIGDASCILAIGTNTTSAHPIIGFKVKQAVQRGTKLIVVNPREIRLCQYADIWLRLRPGTDVALLMGFMKIILEEKLEDKDFISRRCENFESLRSSLAQISLEAVVEITGVPKSQIVKAALLYANSKPASILYTLGITEHTCGTEAVMALADLAMLTGNIGKPGSGVNPLRGQNNVQGACDMGALPGNFPGYQAVDDPVIRKKFEDAWGCKLNPEPGLVLTEIYGAAYDRKIKAAYIIGEDPVLSEPDMKHTIKALSNLDFLVVQEIFLSESAILADVVLPAAGFAADDGTFTNTERRVQRIRKAVQPPGDSKPDWEIVCLIAKKMGATGFDYTHPSQIWSELAHLSPSFGGISYERIEKFGLQWPCPTPEHPGTSILHTMTFTRGKGRFVPLTVRPPAEMPDAEYPLILTTERSIYHYHTGTMTRRVAGLNILRKEELVEINPRDAEELKLIDGDWVTVYSRRGEVSARAKITENSPPGLVCMTFHFSESPTNAVTNTAADPISKTPELKYCAVRVVKRDLGI
jgi:formate dehydrogenase (NADP+) alpha subunit